MVIAIAVEIAIEVEIVIVRKNRYRQEKTDDIQEVRELVRMKGRKDL